MADHTKQGARLGRSVRLVCVRLPWKRNTRSGFVRHASYRFIAVVVFVSTICECDMYNRCSLFDQIQQLARNRMMLFLKIYWSDWSPDILKFALVLTQFFSHASLRQFSQWGATTYQTFFCVLQVFRFFSRMDFQFDSWWIQYKQELIYENMLL